jgi:hypothetical protein
MEHQKVKVMFKKLTPSEYAELWAKIRNAALDLDKNAAFARNAVALYQALDDLEILRRRLQSHYGALLTEAARKL